MSDKGDPSALRDQHTGMIQPHGELLVVSEDSWLVTHGITNVDDMIGWPLDDVLAKPLQSLLAVRQLELLHQLALAPPSPDLLKPWPCSVRTPNGGEIEMRYFSQVHDRSIYLELCSEVSRLTICTTCSPKCRSSSAALIFWPLSKASPMSIPLRSWGRAPRS